MRDDARRPTRLAPGRVIDGTRYRIIRWLGEGGMGLVFEVEQVDLSKRLAMKVLLSDRPDAGGRLLAEARAASHIGSDHIVGVHDFGVLADGREFFTMELLDGSDLAQEIDNAPMDPARLIPILRQACKGLHAAHVAGIYHRDVKPENIVISRRRGRADHVTIVDFGIAQRTASDANTDARALETDGTPMYLAPERWAGQPCDVRAEIYALGCVAYELLSGTPPLAADSLEGIARARMTEDPVPPSKLRPHAAVAKPLEAAVMGCLARDPSERHADMQEFEAALCEAQVALALCTPWDDLPLPDVEPQRRARLLEQMAQPERAVRAAARRKWRLAIGGLVLAALCVAGWFAITQPSDPDTRVQQLIRAARAAAARAHYVYPPAHAPNTATAYTNVVELERMRGGRGPAQQLRRDFAETLVWLGDRYWQRSGGRGFAAEYYLQALVFVPDDPYAADRVALTPAQLASVQGRAAELDFSPRELAALSPLVVLADPDQARVAQQLAALDIDAEVPLNVRANLDRLRTDLPAPADPSPTRPANREPAASPSPPQPAIVEQPAVAAQAPVAEQHPVAPEPRPQAVEQRRSPARAADLVAKARREASRGRRKEAEVLLHRALADDPRHAPALIGLSDIKFDRAQYHAAARFALKAVRAAPRRADYRIKLGDAYLRCVRYPDAEAAYQRALELGHRDAKGRLAKVRRRLGQ